MDCLFVMKLLAAVVTLKKCRPFGFPVLQRHHPLLLPRLALTLRPGGVLSVVLQVPSASSPAVTPSPFVTLQSLESLFHFVDPAVLVEAAQDLGLTLSSRRTEPLPAGKAFEVLRFVKPSR